jgi:peptidoglycan/LPS O-acetylase OafA/YrhL
MARKFETLDGLRGVAALAVVLYHVPGRLHDIAGAGYLAVDLFFLMSGFVIASAYEARLSEGWRASEFLIVRLKRLWPLYALGVALGVGCFLGIRWLRPDAAYAFPPMPVVAAALMSLLFIPQVAPYGGPAFPFNSASWSLSVEIVGNVVYALVARSLSTRMLMLMSAIGFAGLALIWWRAGDLNVGVSPGNIAGGYVRFLFSFPLGVLMYRLHAAGRLPELSPPAWLPLALAAFAFAGWHGADLFVAAVLFPAILMMSLSKAVSPRLGRVFVWAGAVSYPLYILHPPLIELMRFLPRGIGDIAFGLGIIALAALAQRWFDRPLQNVLHRLVQRMPRERLGAQPGA